MSTLVIINIFGLIGFIVIYSVIYAAGKSKDLPISNSAQATKRFLIDFPGAVIHECTISRDGNFALLDAGFDDSRCFGIVRVHGDKLSTRKIEIGSADVTLDSAGLKIDLDDVTYPKAVIPLRATDAQKWASFATRID